MPTNLLLSELGADCLLNIKSGGQGEKNLASARLSGSACPKAQRKDCFGHRAQEIAIGLVHPDQRMEKDDGKSGQKAHADPLSHSMEFSILPKGS